MLATPPARASADADPRADPRQIAGTAPRRARGAGPPAVAQQVEVKLQLHAWSGQLQHRVVELLERSAAAQQPEPGADARDVRIDRNIAQTEAEQQHAGCRLAPDAGQRAERRAAALDRRVAHPVEAQRLTDGAQHLLDS